MGDLRDLYQNTILDHCRNPRNFRNLSHANREAVESNPLCGDQIRIYLTIENRVIKDIGFQGIGCALATASASMMTDHIMGKTEDEAKYIFDCFHQMLSRSVDSAFDSATLGDLIVFSGIREYPVRAKCATLPWKAMREALEKIQES